MTNYITIIVIVMLTCAMTAGCISQDPVVPSANVLNGTEQQEIATLIAQDNAQYVNQTPDVTIVPTPTPDYFAPVKVEVVAPTLVVPGPTATIEMPCPINTVRYYGTCIAGVKVVEVETYVPGGMVDSKNE